MADGVDGLAILYDGPRAQAFYDEAVTELDHALQAAALAVADDAPDELVAAALLHDVGHLIVGDLVPIDEDLSNDFHHERAGATHLARTFGAAVADPVRLHVAAKRYLCAVEPSYTDTLSASSVRSMAVQGGVMSADEVAAFEAAPGAAGAIRVRRWDDAAKVADLDVPPFDTYLPLLRRLAV